MKIFTSCLYSRTRNITGAISSAFNLATLFSLLKFYTSLGMVIGYSGVYWYACALDFYLDIQL